MFEKEAEEWVKSNLHNTEEDYIKAFKDGAETALRKVVKHLSTLVLDEHCGGYFSRLLESEEKLQELATECV